MFTIPSYLEEHKTYEEFMNENPDCIDGVLGEFLRYTDDSGTSKVDKAFVESVKEALFERFQYREIKWTDEKFLNIYRRNLRRRMGRFVQGFRIDPESIDVDWLVTKYRERQLTSDGTNGGFVKHGNDEINTDGSEHSKEKKDFDGWKETSTKDGSMNRSIEGGYKDTSYEGKHTQDEKYIQGKHTTTSKMHVGSKTQNGGLRAGWTGDRQIAASAPMSEKYNNFIDSKKGQTFMGSKDGATFSQLGMPKDLDWDTLDSQGQSNHREYEDDRRSTTTKPVYNKKGEGDTTVEQGTSKSPDKTTSSRHGDRTDPDYNERNYKGYKENTDYNNLRDVREKEGSEVTSKDGSSHEKTTKKYGTVEDLRTDSKLDREQYTGRDEAPAELLDRASEYIQNTSIFQWLCNKVDRCFVMEYNY